MEEGRKHQQHNLGEYNNRIWLGPERDILFPKRSSRGGEEKASSCSLPQRKTKSTEKAGQDTVATRGRQGGSQKS